MARKTWSIYETHKRWAILLVKNVTESVDCLNVTQIPSVAHQMSGNETIRWLFLLQIRLIFVHDIDHFTFTMLCHCHVIHIFYSILFYSMFFISYTENHKTSKMFSKQMYLFVIFMYVHCFIDCMLHSKFFFTRS